MDVRTIADYSGARGSNIGDQFHELWALEQILRLLDRTTGLTAITVEGVSTSQQPGGTHWDAVDCTLYYGGDTLETARRVEIVQLKYSGDPTTSWTASRLSRGPNGRRDRSTLRKLAITYSAARRSVSAGAELSVRFISNQSVAPALADLRQKIAAGATLEAELQPDLVDVTRATGLRDEELRQFLGAVDVSECGRDSRFTQRERVAQVVAKLIEENANADLAELRNRVRELMLPERHRERVKAATVLSWFGIADPAGLFPCPSSIGNVERPVPRAPAQEIARLLTEGQRLVCLHGPGGGGKTTVLQQLVDFLPEHSHLVLFDSYGGGRYLYSDDKRHLPQNAFLQIANDLALSLRTPFLIARERNQPIDVRQFLRCVSDAAAVVAEDRPRALLIVAIDAVDNAVTAADASPPDACFVRELCRANLVDLPPQVRVVLSARTARIDTLGLPADASKVECPPFTRSETATYVRLTWPDAPEAWIDQFHHLSGGIPRVQHYAVRAAQGEHSRALRALRPGGKDLRAVLGEQFREARTKLGDDIAFDAIVGGLALLPPPIPSTYLADLAGTTVHAVMDVFHDLSPGLRADDEGLAIADEDFEHFLHEEVEPRRETLRQSIADLLWARRHLNGYAATHIADALIAADRGSDLLQLAAAEDALQAIPDAIVRREVLLRRLSLALQVARGMGNAVEMLKVVLVGADATKEEAAVREMLEAETDLAIRFARPTLRRLVLGDRSSVHLQGSVLAQDASRAAQAGDRVTARERLASYDAWLRRRQTLPPDERGVWRVSIEDIVARLDALLRIDGPKAALDDIATWRPRTISLQVGLKLLPRLIAAGDAHLVWHALDARLVGEPWTLLFSVPLALSGDTAAAATLEPSLRRLARRHLPRLIWSGPDSDRWQGTLLQLLLTACELATNVGADRDVILRVLGLLRGKLDRRYLMSDPVALDGFLRSQLLELHLRGLPLAVDATLSSILPPADADEGVSGQRDTAEIRRDRETRRKELGALVGALFPTYAARIALIATDPGVELDIEAVQQVLPSPPTDYRFERDFQWRLHRPRAAMSVISLLGLPHVPCHALFEHASSVYLGGESRKSAVELLPLLEQLLYRQEAHEQVLEALMDRGKVTRESRWPAAEKAASFVRLSRLALPVSPDDAEQFFSSAIEVTREIDQEARHQIRLLAELSRSSAALSADERRSNAAEVFRFVSGAAQRLTGYDGFPWPAATTALTRLSPSMALAAVARWADDGTADLQSTFQPLLVEALAAGQLSSDVALALAILLDAPDGDVAERIINASEDPIALTRRAAELARDCLLHAPPSARRSLGRRILDLLPPSLADSIADVRDLRATVEFLDDVQPAEPRVEASAPHRPPNGSFPQGEHRLVTPEAIDELLDRFAAEDRHFDPQQLFQEMRRRTEPRDRIAYLDSLSAAQHERLRERTRSRAILDALEAWGGSGAIDRWRAERLPRVIVRHFAGWSRWIEWGQSELPELIAATRLPATGRVDTLIDGIEATGAELSSEALYRVAELIVADLPRADAAAVLTWYVARLGARVPADPRHTLDPDDVPSDVISALGRFLFALLGDVDTRVRWRAAHALRRLARHGASDVLASVVAEWQRTADGSFRDPEAPYYWLAGRLWLAMTLSRIAGEDASALLSHVQALTRMASDPELPHVLIREHAKRAITRLDQKVGLGSDVDWDALRLVNQPRLTTTERRDLIPRSSRYADQGELAFHFSSMDTIPYWYEPLLRLFAGISQDEFLRRCEAWIIGRWGAPPTASRWDTEPRKGRYDENRYGLWTHSHGSLPTIERYATYLEWHAMFCVLGGMLETHALSTSTDPFDNYDEWFADWLPTDPDHWISDLRSPTPLESKLWKPDSRPGELWLRSVKGHELVDELGLSARPGWVVIAGRYEAQFPRRHFTVTLSSALVSPDTAAPLARALTLADWHSFRIPNEQDDLQIDTPPYRLIGWLASRSQEMRFSEHDPLRHQARPKGIEPGAAVAEYLGLALQEGSSTLWVAPDGDRSFVYEVWSDLVDQDGDHRSAAGADGWRLWVNVRVLQRFLSFSDMDLVCEVRIDRETHPEYSQRYDERKRRTSHRVFVCRRDGQIDGATARVGAWKATREGARPPVK